MKLLTVMAALALSLAFAGRPARALAQTPTPAAPAEAERTVRVAGAVTNGTPGAAVPAGLPVTLNGYDDFSLAHTLTTVTDGSGAFAFEAVPHREGRVYLVSVQHGGAAYGSDIVKFEAGQTAAHVALTVYEVTSDPADLRIEQLRLTVDVSAGQVGFTENILVSNAGEQTFAPQTGGGMEFPLPAGATEAVAQIQRGNPNLTRTAEGFTLDIPLRPGLNLAQVAFSFRLPARRPLEFAQPVRHFVAAVTVFVPQGVFLQGDGWQDQGAQTVEGKAFHVYSAAGLAAGASLSFQLSGGALARGASPSVTPLLLGLGALALGLVATGGWLVWRSRRAAPALSPANRDELLQALADLDDAFSAGKVDEAEHRRKRARLKARLARQIRSEELRE